MSEFQGIEFDLESWFNGWKTVAEVEATRLELPTNVDGSIDKDTMDSETRDRFVRMETIAEVLNSLVVSGIILGTQDELNIQ